MERELPEERREDALLLRDALLRPALLRLVLDDDFLREEPDDLRAVLRERVEPDRDPPRELELFLLLPDDLRVAILDLASSIVRRRVQHLGCARNPDRTCAIGKDESSSRTMMM